MVKMNNSYLPFAVPPAVNTSLQKNYRCLALTRFPKVVQDKILSLLGADDLRSVHQVSKSWKEIVESRPKINYRRKDRVTSIKLNKENIDLPSMNQETVPAATDHRAVRERSGGMSGKKNGADGYFLMECTNTTPTLNNMSNHASTPNSYLTPTSRFEFQEFEEAEKSLERGQKLYKCRRCRGPVPSPVAIPDESTDSRRLSRCKLTSRITEAEEYHAENQERKKARTLSAGGLSPIPFSPPVTVASLGEKMTQSLVLSSPALSLSSNSVSHLGLEQTNLISSIDMRRSTSCSSITGIDLPNSIVYSPVNLSLNLSSGFNNSSTQLHLSSIEIDCNRLSCERSCCRRQNLHNSQYSDSGFSLDSDCNTAEIIESANFLPSPGPTGVREDFDSHFDQEKGRFHDFSSDGAFSSSSSFVFQHSYPNISNESSFPILECPNSTCGFRFCSNCEETEHLGRPCHIIGSESFENMDSTSFKSSISNPERSRNNSKKSSSSSKNKKHLKRLLL